MKSFAHQNIVQDQDGRHAWHKQSKWENTPHVSLPVDDPTSKASPPNQSETVDTTGSSSSHRIKETESTRKAFMTIQSLQHSTKVTPALSAFFPLKKSTTTTDRIKDFAKREHSHIDLNHKLREIELASYRQELVTQRRLLLFLAYAMTRYHRCRSLGGTFCCTVSRSEWFQSESSR